MGELYTVIVAGSAFVGSLAGIASLAWWLSGQFQQVKDSVLVKLEEHEKLDNERFENTRLSIMKLELWTQSQGKNLHQI